MLQFIVDNIVAIVFGLTTTIMSGVALRYKIREQKLKVEDIAGEGRRVSLFLSRQSMLKYLLSMYDRGSGGDIVWGQCVGCTTYSQVVRSKLLEAAGKGVKFRMIVNAYTPALDEFRALFEPLSSAELVEGKDNALRVQGLSDCEVVVAVPGVDSYTAVLIKDPSFVRVIKEWFDARFESLKAADTEN